MVRNSIPIPGSPGGGEVVTLQQRTPSSGRVSPPTQRNVQQQADPFSAFDSTTPPPAHLQTSRASASPPTPPPPAYYPPNPAQQQQQQQQQNLQLQQQQQKLQTLQQQHQLQQQQLQQQQQRAATQTLTKSGSDPVNRAHPTTNAPAYPGVPLATPATTARLPPTHLSPCLVSAPAAASSISHTDATATLIDVPETRRSLMDELPPQSYGSSSAYPAIHPPGSGNVGPGSGPAGDARSLFRADPLRASLQHYLHAEPSQAAAPTSSRPPPLLKMFSGFGNTGGFGDDAAWGADSSGFGAEDDAFPAQRAPSSSSSSSRFIPPDLLTTSAAAVDSSSGAQGPDAGPTKLTSRSPPPAAEPRPSMDHGAVSRPSQPLLTAASSQSLPHSLSRTPTPAAPASVSDQAGLVSSGRLDPAAAAAAAAMGAGSLPGVDRPSPAHGSSSSSTAPAVATATAGATEVLTQQRSAAAHSPLPLPPALASDSLLPAALAVRLVQQGSLSACPLPRSPVRSRGHTPSHSRSNSNAMDVFAELDIVGSSSSHSRALAAVPQPMVPSAFPPPGLQAAASADLQHASSLPAAVKPAHSAAAAPAPPPTATAAAPAAPAVARTVSGVAVPAARPVAAAAGLLGITSADLNELAGAAVAPAAHVAHVRSNSAEGVPPPPASVSSPPAARQLPIGDAGMGAVVHSSSGAVSREEGALREELNLVKSQLFQEGAQASVMGSRVRQLEGQNSVLLDRVQQLEGQHTALSTRVTGLEGALAKLMRQLQTTTNSSSSSNNHTAQPQPQPHSSTSSVGSLTTAAHSTGAGSAAATNASTAAAAAAAAAPASASAHPGQPAGQGQLTGDVLGSAPAMTHLPQPPVTQQLQQQQQPTTLMRLSSGWSTTQQGHQPQQQQQQQQQGVARQPSWSPTSGEGSRQVRL
ncbi:MAG: hypothetical protein WDW36_006183 [Sanguina aurantia]